ncbi:ubiquitin C-terminal hydrolase-like protein [Pyrenochaeta sp. DS3sAY3a]|nr:ubiquitin C-terminal hydrolase-like protein [Pyrenochaeta sp. DS3sAY3a]
MAPGKTAPRLVQDLLTYDARYEHRSGRNLLTSSPPQFDPDKPTEPAVPHRNCRHALFTKSEQSEPPAVDAVPDSSTRYKIASYCSLCHWHIDVTVDFRDNGSKTRPCKQGDKEYFLHHFIYDGEDDPAPPDGLGAHNRPRSFRFRCSAPHCPVQVTTSFKPPNLSEQDIETLTNKAQLRSRLEKAKQLAGDRADSIVARRVDGPDFLNTYLQDAMNPVTGKSRIPLLNRKFLKTFGRDCNSILMRLGFTNRLEEQDDGEMVDVWYLPAPEAPSSVYEPTLRNVLEDARYELNSIILSLPEIERTNVRHKAMYPPPARGNIELALACEDYEKVKGRMETRSTNHEEDHPYYASLGAVGDFSDALVLFAFSRQAEQDYANQAYYFECLQDLAVGRNSDVLGTQVAIMASQGLTSKRDLESAYKYFGIDPAHANVISDEHIIGTFMARLSDIPASAVEEARKQLRVLGDARNSDKIRAEAAEAIETEEQALRWLDLDPGVADDFIQTMFSLKTQDNPACLETARKAVSVIADHRHSYRLREFLDKGTMAEPDMDVGEAYALFQVDNRTLALDLDVLKTTVDVAPPGEVEKLQKAFAIIQQDQAQNHNNLANDLSNPEARRNSFPLDSWPVGLRNIGNTCYLNSVLQFLFTIKPLRELILNCEKHMDAPSPEAMAGKKVGRIDVTVDRAIVAQKFVRELQAFFQQMMRAPTDTVQPAIDLASLALCRTDSPEEPDKPAMTQPVGGTRVASPDAGTADESVLVQNDVANNMTPPDSVMGEDIDDARSVSSMQAMDLGDHSDKPAPPTRPPPVPPRPETSVKADQTKTKIGILEENARQQDAAEVMGNIFDLISCAIKGGSKMPDGEQLDLIKELFFSDVTTVRATAKGPEKLGELRHNLLVSPGFRDRHLYAALDDDFGQNELEDGTLRYDYIDHAAPILVINVRRIQWKNELVYDRSQIGLDNELHLDRYLGKTNSLSELQLLQLREAQWMKQRQLREVEAARKKLRETEIEGMDLAGTVNEAGDFLESLFSEGMQTDEQEPQGLDSLLTPPPELADALREKAEELKKELEGMETLCTQLESQVDTVFKDCHDHPYRLHAIFTHRGGVRGGHYWIYIYDFQNGLWRQYNDDHVTIADEQQIFEREEGKNTPKASTGVVYIRADIVDDLTQAVCRNPTVIEKTETEAHDRQTEMQQTQDTVMQDQHDDNLLPLENVKYDGLKVIEGVDPQ